MALSVTIPETLTESIDTKVSASDVGRVYRTEGGRAVLIVKDLDDQVLCLNLRTFTLTRPKSSDWVPADFREVEATLTLK